MEPHTEKSAEKKKKRRSKSVTRRNIKYIFRFLPFILPPVITAFIYTWLYTRTNIVALPVEGLRAQKTELMKRNDALRVNIEQLQDPRRIEIIAHEKLGMISPNIWQVIVLDKPVRAPETAVQLADSPVQPQPSGFVGSLRENVFSGDDASAAQISTQAAGQPG
jgi:cell division protein FtsB